MIMSCPSKKSMSVLGQLQQFTHVLIYLLECWPQMQKFKCNKIGHDPTGSFISISQIPLAPASQLLAIDIYQKLFMHNVWGEHGVGLVRVMMTAG